MKKRIFCLLMLIFMLLLYTSCGKSKDYNGVLTDEYSSEANADTSNSMDLEKPSDTNRKIIIEASYDIETKDLNESVTLLEKKVLQLNGYYQSSQLHGSTKVGGTGEYVIRIPTENLNSFSSDLSALGNIINQSSSGEDVTTQYFDIENQLSALKIQQERLLVLLNKAQTLDEILKLENELTTVRTKIESLTTNLKKYDNLIEYSTVCVNISQVENYTKLSEQSFGTQLVETFKNSFEAAGKLFKYLILAFVWLLPYLVIVMIILAVILIALKLKKKK